MDYCLSQRRCTFALEFGSVFLCRSRRLEDWFCCLRGVSTGEEGCPGLLQLSVVVSRVSLAGMLVFLRIKNDTVLDLAMLFARPTSTCWLRQSRTSLRYAATSTEWTSLGQHPAIRGDGPPTFESQPTTGVSAHGVGLGGSGQGVLGTRVYFGFKQSDFCSWVLDGKIEGG